jgi:hypothetical protein
MIAKIEVEDLRLATLPQEGGLLVQGGGVEEVYLVGLFLAMDKWREFEVRDISLRLRLPRSFHLI